MDAATEVFLMLCASYMFVYSNYVLIKTTVMKDEEKKFLSMCRVQSRSIQLI